MNYYKIYPEYKFIHTWTTGSDYETLIDFYKKVAEHDDFSKDFVGLVDIRQGMLEMTPEESIEIAKYVVDSDYSHSRWVFLVSEPYVTALSLVYQNVVLKKHELYVVSTLKAASKYLGLELEKIIGS